MPSFPPSAEMIQGETSYWRWNSSFKLYLLLVCLFHGHWHLPGIRPPQGHMISLPLGVPTSSHHSLPSLPLTDVSVPLSVLDSLSGTMSSGSTHSWWPWLLPGVSCSFFHSVRSWAWSRGPRCCLNRPLPNLCSPWAWQFHVSTHFIIVASCPSTSSVYLSL